MTFEFDGIQFNYLSHLEENLFDQTNSVFKWGNKSYENEFGQRISQASSKSRKIKLICFSIEKTLNKNPVPKFQYERNALKAFSRRSENNMIKEKEYEKARNQNPERKEKKRKLDEARDQQPERKELKKICDKVRDQQPERKEMKKICDKVQDQQPERKEMKKICDKVQDQQPERKEMKKICDK